MVTHGAKKCTVSNSTTFIIWLLMQTGAARNIIQHDMHTTTWLVCDACSRGSFSYSTRARQIVIHVPTPVAVLHHCLTYWKWKWRGAAATYGFMHDRYTTAKKRRLRRWTSQKPNNTCCSIHVISMTWYAVSYMAFFILPFMDDGEEEKNEWNVKK